MRSNNAVQAVLLMSCIAMTGGVEAQGIRMIEPTDRTVSVQSLTAGKQDAEQAPAAPVAQPTPAARPATSGSAAAEGEEFVETIRRAPGEQFFLSQMRVDNIFVSNPAVITATVRDSGIEVRFVGRGTSNLELTRGGEKLVYRFITVTTDVDRSLEELRRLLSDVIGVNVERVGDSIVASGRILTQEDSRRYETAIGRYDVIDLVERRFFQVEQERLLSDLMDVYRTRDLHSVTADLRTNNRGEPFVLLGGVAYTDRAKDNAGEIASSYFQNVTNLISLDKPEIQIDAILVTIDMDKGTQRGRQGGPFTDIILNLGTRTDPIGGITMDAVLSDGNWEFSDQTLFGQVLDGGSVLRFLKNEDRVVNYVEAFSVVKSGESTTFQDGGSILVPLVGAETVGLASIDTGLVLNMTPFVDDNRKITVNVDLDFNSTTSDGSNFTGGGPNTPGTLSLRTSRSSSTITADNGQTIVVSGINSNLYATSIQKTPLLGKIPIVNLFFKSASRRGTNVRSFFFITPNVPTLFNEGRQSIAADGPVAREHFERESQYDVPGVGFYLGWEKDIKTDKEIAPAPWDME